MVTGGVEGVEGGYNASSMLVYTLIILYHCVVASITSGICLNIILTDGWPLCWLASIVWPAWL